MEPTDRNRRAFDDRHGGRSTTRLGLPSIVRITLGDLTKKRVLHLACGTGEGAAELAELGAVVTAIDESADTLEAARERWPSILWVQADPEALPRELRRGRFDLVYSGLGSLVAVRDLDGWLRGVAATLREGGDLLLYEEHPVALAGELLRSRLAPARADRHVCRAERPRCACARGVPGPGRLAATRCPRTWDVPALRATGIAAAWAFPSASS
jgi:SAM-dependent methyltransferase